MKQILAATLIFAFFSFAQANVRIHSLYEPLAHADTESTGCAVSFQPHQGTNTKILIMTYADSESQACALRGQSMAFQCDAYFCHSGDVMAYKTDYVAIYSSADSAHLLIRINHCTSGCSPFGTVTYEPLPAQNANYELKAQSL